MSFDLSIILATKNRGKLLGEMLSSLQKAAERISYEIIVIDGNSTDNTTEILKEFNVNKIFSEREQFGEGRHSWSRLYNFGFKHASGRWGMYASDDIIFDKNSLDNAIEFLNSSNESVGGGAFFYKNVIAEGEWKDYGVDLTHGNNVFINYGLIRIDLFHKVNGLDEDYKFYCADGDLCLKLLKEGYKILPLPYSKIIHKNDLDVNKKENLTEAEKDISYYKKKWQPYFNTATPNPRRIMLDVFFNHYENELKLMSEKIEASNLALKEKNKFKLHLGCGERYLEGYINIDYPPSEHSVQRNTKVDLYADITKLDYQENSIDEIRLHHVFEHFDRPAALALLCKWNKWLKAAGKLIIETPDLEGCISLLIDKALSYQQKQAVLRHVFGSHEAKWAYHYDGWYEEKYKYILTRLGYEITNIEHTEYELTRNIVITAQKKIGIKFNEIVESGKQILRDSMVNNSETEERLWKIWCAEFEGKLSVISHLDSSESYRKEIIPLVSIFMPVYNGEKYLSETLDSLLSQTFSGFEIIIVDDGSTDRTLDIATGYAKRDERIKVFSVEHRGEVFARNFALTKISSTSKYLMNHDSDDISMPQKLEKLVTYLESEPDVDIAGCAAEYFNDQGKQLGQPSIEYDYPAIKNTFGRKNSVINSAALIRKKVFDKIGNYREEFKSVDDYDFFARALIAGFKIINLKEVLHKIRLHSNSIGSKRAQIQKILASKISSYYNWSINKKSDAKYKLHLGCGDVKLENFINVDIDPYLNEVDIVDDIKELRNFDKNSVGLIYACHVLEHFPNDEIKSILSRWFEVLDYNAELRISVPDIDRIVSIYNRNKKHFLKPGNTPWIGLLYGGQTDIYDYHKTGFNFTYLKTMLEEVGFIDVKEYPHSPHWLGIPFDASMAKEPFNEYISLNIMAKKPGQIPKKTFKHSDKHLDILHTVEYYHPHVGGAELVVQELSERLVKRGHSVTVATSKISGRNFNKLNGVTVKEFDLSGSIGNGISGSGLAKYQEFLTSSPADIMMNYAAQQWGTDIVFTVLDRLIKSRINIIAPCGYSALQDSRTIRWTQFSQYYNEFIPKIIPLYDAAVYHSSGYQDYEFAMNHGFSNSVIIPNGVGEEEFEKRPGINFRQKYGIKKRFMALCVANYYKSKGHERIINAVKELQRSDISVVFIGKDGEELSYLKKAAENLDIIFLQKISREDTVAAYHQADLFLFGSRIEAFPLVILEAKASKTPFISTSCGNVRKLKGGIICEENGISVTINKLLDNETLRKKLAAEGYAEWKEKFTWESVVDKYEELYLRLYHKKFVNGVRSRINGIQSQLQNNYRDIYSYLQAARLLINNNEMEEAKKYLEDALELDFENIEANNLLNLIPAEL
ncbi:MAG: glycosyltransferase [Bacteroidetes bacterium]|nr:glycosyltransferase [Bacteroidota bacterium]